MTNKQRIEDKLRKDGFVDNFWAIDSRITTRLGAVINVLKREGWTFDDTKSGYLGATKNWRYVLVSAPAPKPRKDSNFVRGVGHLPDFTGQG
jgi:hypothetical protein